MILPFELERYIDEHSSEDSPLLQQVTRNTHLKTLHPQMLSGHVQGRFLEMISCMLRPKYILELGTFTGYSALCLAKGLEPEGELHTIEIDDELEDTILNHFSQSDQATRLHLHIGDALDIIPRLNHPFDLVFIDADKRLYPRYLELVLPLLRKGGILLADNTLWYGKVIDNTASDAQTNGINAFNAAIHANEALENVILSIRDGITMAIKS